MIENRPPDPCPRGEGLQPELEREEGTAVQSAPAHGEQLKGEQFKTFLRKMVFRNPVIWVLAVFAPIVKLICLIMVKLGFQDPMAASASLAGSMFLMGSYR